MKKKLFYPAIFHIAEEGGYWVTFPDFPEAFTQGDSMEEAYSMAVDSLGFTISERKKAHENIPTATSFDSLKSEADSVVVAIQFDMLDYLKKHNNKAVKKTLSIPAWLNELAVDAGINFSQTLQEALLNKVQL